MCVSVRVLRVCVRVLSVHCVRVRARVLCVCLCMSV
jgi:hypothetical protein